MTKAQSRHLRSEIRDEIEEIDADMIGLKYELEELTKRIAAARARKASFVPSTRSSERMQQAVRVLGRVLARRIDELEQLRAASADHREVVHLNRLRREVGRLLLKLCFPPKKK